MRPTTNCSVKWEIKLIYATELILGSLRSRLNKLQEAIWPQRQGGFPIFQAEYILVFNLLIFYRIEWVYSAIAEQ